MAQAATDAPTQPQAAPAPDEPVERNEQPDTDSADREALQYWGYLFQADKTGTDKLKKLLRGLKDAMNARYEPSDQSDLTPTQLARFYQDMHGNYDQLFLGTPNESIAFIYKSLGCLHSLQPVQNTHATAFTDPTVPALKTEGWIMWQTIQILLGPEEHSGFLREAVASWDIKDQDTGELYPKLLPRQCFPTEPDKHMVAWYEGVSERLRREAEDEERRKEITAQEDSDPAPGPRRLHDRMPPRRDGDRPTDDETSVDSRGSALAYFRDPLYRHVDGRPSIVRRNSRRPGLSPRPTMMDKRKGAATTFGHIVRQVGSPHLWDGRGGSRSGSRDRDRDRRRRSTNPDPPHRHYQGGEPASAASYENRPSPKDHSLRRPRRSSQVDRPGTATSADEGWDEGDDDDSPVYSPAPPEMDHKRHHHRGSMDGRDQSLRHSRSHEPTPSQKEADDYFGGYDDLQRQRRSSAHDTGAVASPPDGRNSVGPSFGPSASPLFASHVARHPQPPPPSRLSQQVPSPQHRMSPHGVPPALDGYDDGRPPARNPSIRRAQGRYPSRSPARPPADDRRYDSPRPRHEHGPPSGPPLGGYSSDSRYPDDRDGRHAGDRRSAHVSGSDLGGGGGGYYSGGDDNGRHSRQKQTRFADTGVGGRRYPDESSWRRGN